jgi:hypothetical protein
VTVVDGPAPALLINPAALAQRVAKYVTGHRSATPPLLLVAGTPSWPFDPVLTGPDGVRFTVVTASSVLAIWEQAVADRELPCVILTTVPEEALGTGLLSRVLGRRILRMEPWALIADSFGAQQLDPRLETLRWAGPALLDAMPPKGWPKLAGTILQRDVALRHLTARRLELPDQPDEIDAPALLRWSATPGARQQLAQLADDERSGLLSWMSTVFGATGTMLQTLSAADHLADALPLGLVCAALWDTSDAADARAQGRIEQYAGGVHLDATTVQEYGTVVTDTVVELLHAGDRRAGLRGGAVSAQSILDRAEDLLTMFSARPSARRSMTLPTGFDNCLDAAAAALRQALDAHTAGDSDTAASAVATADAAAGNLARHALAHAYRHRVERVEMAVRLLRWLGTSDGTINNVDDGINQQMTQWSWVDVALGHVWTGEDAHADLARSYRLLHDRVRARRRAVDAAFASRLAQWATDPGAVLTVESVLPKVVAPVVHDGERGVLLIVMDGMSAAVANELTVELTGAGWQEFDPIGVRGSSTERAHRRGVVSGLPSITAVSRTSLLTASLRRGDQGDERAAFEKHPLWRGRKARLFHKNTLYGGAGGVLHPDLLAALGEPDTLVGVVINTVDDALDRGRESADSGWQLSQLGPLRTLLDHASYQGRAVVITSDHGHVLERGGDTRPAASAASARHRIDTAPPGDGEIELVGARVLDGDHRVVALWDENLRYLPRRAGYHGGASLAEVTVPVIALLPLGAAAPSSWQALGPQQPTWWDAPAEVVSPAPAGVAEQSVAERPRKQPRTTVVVEQDNALFDLGPVQPAAPAEHAAAPTGLSIIDQVLESEMFHAQHALTPRRVALTKIRGALTALIEANGTMPTVLVAQRAGEAAGRASGFVTTLQRIFNVDNYAVLAMTDDGRTTRLDLELLRQQFGISGGRS